MGWQVPGLVAWVDVFKKLCEGSTGPVAIITCQATDLKVNI